MRNRVLARSVVLLGSLLVAGTARSETPVGTSFTYQGRFEHSGVPVTGPADFAFSLWDAPSGVQVGGTQTINSVTVTNGLFTVVLNDSAQFGATPFNGNGRWLQIQVRHPAGAGVFTPLVPRVQMTAGPYSHFALRPWVQNGNFVQYTGGTDASLAGGGYVVIGSTGGNNIVMDGNEIMARNDSGTSTLFLNNEGGDVVIAPLYTTKVGVLEITGGADLSERFDVSAPRVDGVPPGAVVSIDPERPGALRLAARAYDTTVAGIVSGAGGVKPGMLMAQTGTAAGGRYPVALSGRVYCQADASLGAIRPGDFLTTSDTPGHAMKAADADRARGAILGKAMTPLAAGQRGLVLVLVNLQ